MRVALDEEFEDEDRQGRNDFNEASSARLGLAPVTKPQTGAKPDRACLPLTDTIVRIEMPVFNSTAVRTPGAQRTSEI